MDEEDDRVHLPNPNADKANAQHGKSLEALLATKNKKILEELTKFRVRSFVIWHSLRAYMTLVDSSYRTGGLSLGVSRSSIPHFI
jgi:hypothetical protein